MSKGAAKKEHILTAGIEVMKRQGYNGCSIKDIVLQAQVPKGSFYNYFDSKEAFAIEAVEWVSHESCVYMENALQNRGLPPLERLLRFFEESAQCAADANFKVGCFLGNMGQEMSDISDDVRRAVNHAMRRQADLINEVISSVIDAESLSLDKDTTTEFIYSAWEGAIMRAKCSKSTFPLDAFLSMVKHLLKPQKA